MIGGTEICGKYMKTKHFELRQAQRKIPDAQVILALQYGRRFYEGEDRVYFLGRKHLPNGLDSNMVHRANGTVVVVGVRGELLTTYRNPRFIRELRRRQS